MNLHGLFGQMALRSVLLEYDPFWGALTKVAAFPTLARTPAFGEPVPARAHP